jgi:hypothetical protein
MVRTLKVIFRRDPARDRSQKQIHYEGYQVLWPDGSPVTVGLDAFCRHGQRLLGLGQHLKGCSERLVDLLFYPLRDREDNLTRIPGCRVRRFFIQRQGRQGRVHFLDGTPTTVVFDLDRDDWRVVHWCGLSMMPDGKDQWFDLAARIVDPSRVLPVPARDLALHESLHNAAI